MSAPTMTMNPQQPPQAFSSPEQRNVSPMMETVDRHDFAVQKQRKYSSTGGGRAWTEQEVRLAAMAGPIGPRTVD